MPQRILDIMAYIVRLIGQYGIYGYWIVLDDWIDTEWLDAEIWMMDFIRWKKVDIFEYLITCMRQFQLSIFCLVFSFNAVLSQDYFQQEVNYRITVSLNDSANSLSGFESISYINHHRKAFPACIFTYGPMPIKMIQLLLHDQQLVNGNTDFHFASASEHGLLIPWNSGLMETS